VSHVGAQSSLSCPCCRTLRAVSGRAPGSGLDAGSGAGGGAGEGSLVSIYPTHIPRVTTAARARCGLLAVPRPPARTDRHHGSLIGEGSASSSSHYNMLAQASSAATPAVAAAFDRRLGRGRARARARGELYLRLCLSPRPIQPEGPATDITRSWRAAHRGQPPAASASRSSSC
jgi:hypothetical protein